MGRPQKALDGCQEIVVISRQIHGSKYSAKQDKSKTNILEGSIEGKSKCMQTELTDSFLITIVGSLHNCAIKRIPLFSFPLIFCSMLFFFQDLSFFFLIMSPYHALSDSNRLGWGQGLGMVLENKGSR